jgi:competence protein ComEA
MWLLVGNPPLPTVTAMVTSAQLRNSVGLDPSGWAVTDPDEDDDGAPISRPARITISAVIGLALVGLALTAVGVVMRSAGDLQTVSVDDIPVLTVTDSVGEQPGSTPQTVIVHVIGQVARPGIVELEAGARVIDAIEAAGGLSGEADVEALNLARVLSDGEQVHVPAVGEEVRAQPAGSPEGSSGPISLSRADQATLETLPGVGPALAQRIIAWRESNGPFRSVSDVLAVSGIGPATLERFADQVVP